MIGRRSQRRTLQMLKRNVRRSSSKRSICLQNFFRFQKFFPRAIEPLWILTLRLAKPLKMPMRWLVETMGACDLNQLCIWYFISFLDYTTDKRKETKKKWVLICNSIDLQAVNSFIQQKLHFKYELFCEKVNISTVWVSLKQNAKCFCIKNSFVYH